MKEPLCILKLKKHKHACEGCEYYKPVTYTLPCCEKTKREFLPGDYVIEKPEWCPLEKTNLKATMTL